MRSIFSSATQEAEPLHQLDTYFSLAALAVLLLVGGLALYITVRFRDKGDGVEPAQTSSNLRLESLMLGGRRCS